MFALQIPIVGMAQSSSRALLTHRPFSSTPGGAPVELYTSRNRSGIEVQIGTYRGIVTAIRAPDRSGHFGDVALGYSILTGYLKDSPLFGALIGRGNRILTSVLGAGGTHRSTIVYRFKVQ